MSSLAAQLTGEGLWDPGRGGPVGEKERGGGVRREGEQRRRVSLFIFSLSSSADSRLIGSERRLNA